MQQLIVSPHDKYVHKDLMEATTREGLNLTVVRWKGHMVTLLMRYHTCKHMDTNIASQIVLYIEGYMVDPVNDLEDIQSWLLSTCTDNNSSEGSLGRISTPRAEVEGLAVVF